MATIPMIPVGRVTTLNRSILLTERRMSGSGGDDLFVDTVGMSCWRISILQQSQVILYINAGFVKTTMTSPSPRVTVATGRLGDPRRRCREEAKAQDGPRLGDKA